LAGWMNIRFCGFCCVMSVIQTVRQSVSQYIYGIKQEILRDFG